MIDYRSLIKAGVHFGHLRLRWSPKMAPYVWGCRGGIHLIDVSKTAQLLQEAANFIQKTVAEGKSILWVGTKKSAQGTIEKVAKDLRMPYVTHRWVGGTLSNYSQVKKSATKLLHLRDIVSKSQEQGQRTKTKKEINVIGKTLERLERNVEGILNLRPQLGAIFIVDVQKEEAALREASQMNVPIIALVDTNGDPTLVDYVIPGNDDAPRSVNIIVEYVYEAAKRGLEDLNRKKASGDITVQEAAEPMAEEAMAEVAISGGPIALLEDESSDDIKPSKVSEKTVVKKNPTRVKTGQPRRSSSNN